MKAFKKNQMRIDNSIEQLRKKLILLRNELDGELKKIDECKEKGKDYRPNEAGIIQVDGNKIDNICGKIAGLYEMRDILQDEE